MVGIGLSMRTYGISRDMDISHVVPDKLYFPLAPEITIIVVPFTRGITDGLIRQTGSQRWGYKERTIMFVRWRKTMRSLTYYTLHFSLTYNVDIKCDVS